MVVVDADGSYCAEMPSSIRRSILFLSGARLILNTTHRFVYPFLPAIARGLGVPLEQAALLISVRHFAGLATPATNNLVGQGERRRRLITTGLALFIAGCAVTALSGLYVGALVGFAFLGLAKPVFDVSSQAYISDRVPYERRARYLASFEFTWSISLLVGAPLTGWLISKTDWATPFWVFGLIGAAAILLLPRFIEADNRHASAETPSSGLGRPALAFLIVVGLFTMAAEIIFVVFAAWLENSFAVSVAVLGGAAFLIAAAELAGEGGTFAFTDRIGKRRAVMVGLVVSMAGYGALSFASSNMAAGLALIGLAMFGFEFTIVSSFPLASELVPASRGRYLGWLVFALGVGRGIGAALGPALYSSFDLAGAAVAAMAANALALTVIATQLRDDQENVK